MKQTSTVSRYLRSLILFGDFIVRYLHASAFNRLSPIRHPAARRFSGARSHENRVSPACLRSGRKSIGIEAVGLAKELTKDRSRKRPPRQNPLDNFCGRSRQQFRGCQRGSIERSRKDTLCSVEDAGNCSASLQSERARHAAVGPLLRPAWARGFEKESSARDGRPRRHGTAVPLTEPETPGTRLSQKRARRPKP